MRFIMGSCLLFVFAAGVFVVGGAVSFLGASQKTCVVFLRLPLNF